MGSVWCVRSGRSPYLSPWDGPSMVELPAEYPGTTPSAKVGQVSLPLERVDRDIAFIHEFAATSSGPLDTATSEQREAQRHFDFCHDTMSFASPTRQPHPQSTTSKSSPVGVGMWTEEEHARFLDGVKLFSSGPWKRVAAYVGTRNVRQTMTHAQKYRLKAARRLREAQRKQAAARYRLRAVHLNRTIESSPGRRPPQDLSLSKGSGLGSLSKMRLPCSCLEKHCSHTTDESKVYMSIADAVEILDSKASLFTGSPVSTDDALSNSWLDIGKLDPVVSLEAFGSDDLIPLDSTVKESVAFPTLEDCASELLELLF